MPRCDGEGSVITFYPFELAVLLDGFLGGVIDATDGLGEVQDGGPHFVSLNRLHFFTIAWP